MAGHSQFKNIMHRKGKQDKMRSKLFSKLAREVTVAAKEGGPDPDSNARLRLAVQNARAQSMPRDNIERAISKAAGAEGDDYAEIRYEGYGPALRPGNRIAAYNLRPLRREGRRAAYARLWGSRAYASGPSGAIVDIAARTKMTDIAGPEAKGTG